MDKSDQTEIGVLSKLHGYKGAYHLYSDRPIDDDIEDWESVFLEIQGLLVPFFIESVRITSENSAVIKFEDIDTPEIAREFLSCTVFKTLKKSSRTSIKQKSDNFEGYLVVDKMQGVIGSVKSVLNYNQNILLSIMNKGKEILIPFSEEIIISVNNKKKEILVDAPEGLIDLN